MVRFKIRVMFRVRVRVKDRVMVVMEFCIRVQFLLLIPWSGMGRTYSLLAITVTVYILTMTHQTLKHPTFFLFGTDGFGLLHNYQFYSRIITL